MATADTNVNENGYSFTARKSLLVSSRGAPITASPDTGLLANVLERNITFTASVVGTVGTTALANVTGVVALDVFGVCSSTLQGVDGLIRVGTNLVPAGLIADTVATGIDINEIWHDASPDASIEATSIVGKNIVTEDIIYTIGSTAISDGAIDFYIVWSPISDDGDVKAP